MLLGVYRGYIGIIGLYIYIGLYGENGKENGPYYIIILIQVVYFRVSAWGGFKGMPHCHSGTPLLPIGFRV